VIRIGHALSAGARLACIARRSLPRAPGATLLLLSAIAALAIAGCGPGNDQPLRAVEREEIRGPIRFRLRSELKPARATIGDRVAWRLIAELPRGTAAGPALRDSAPAALEWTERAAPTIRDRRKAAVWSWSVTVRGYDLGAIPLPRVALPLRRGSVTDTLVFPTDTLYVDSLTQAASGEVPAARGPVATELRPIDWVVAAAALVLAITAAIVGLPALRRRRGQRKGNAPSSSGESPEEALLRGIAALRAEAGSLASDVFHERLSTAIRSYAASVTGVPALDRTTRELSHELRRETRVEPEALVELVGLLERADLAKFARHDEWCGRSDLLDQAASLAARLVPPRVGEPPSLPAPGGPDAEGQATKAREG